MMNIFFVFQTSLSIQVSLNEDGLIVAALENSDLRDNVTAYGAQLSGEPRFLVYEFTNGSEPLLINTSFHGLCYSVGLVLRQGLTWTKPLKSVPVLTSEESFVSSLLLENVWRLSISEDRCFSHLKFVGFFFFCLFRATSRHQCPDPRL